MHAYIRSDSVVSRVIAGETLIVPVRKGVGDLASIYCHTSVSTRNEGMFVLAEDFRGG